MRSDLWAFGSMLYEMATGLRAFEGKTQASLIASILKEEPRPVPEVVPGATPAFDHVVRRCLSKDPDDRWQTTRDMLAQLRWIAAGEQSSAEHVPPAPLSSKKIPVWGLPVALVLGVALFASGWMLNRPAPTEVAVMRAAVVLPVGTDLDSDNRSIAVSPDGSVLAYSAGDDGSGSGCAPGSLLHLRDRGHTVLVPRHRSVSLPTANCARSRPRGGRPSPSATPATGAVLPGELTTSLFSRPSRSALSRGSPPVEARLCRSRSRSAWSSPTATRTSFLTASVSCSTWGPATSSTRTTGSTAWMSPPVRPRVW